MQVVNCSLFVLLPLLFKAFCVFILFFKCWTILFYFNVLMYVSAGRPIIVDFSPVTDFREATCRQYEEDACNRGGYCNFMHLKRISRLSKWLVL